MNLKIYHNFKKKDCKNIFGKKSVKIFLEKKTFYNKVFFKDL